MTFQDKLEYLTKEYILILDNTKHNPKALWGKMNFQEMVEHMWYSVAMATGKFQNPLISPIDKLEQMKAFAVSDKPFRENTPNPIIGENPMPLRHENLNSSIRELEAEIQFFKKIYESNPKLTAQNPFFGEMNFQEWVALFYKHANHHLKHFGLINQD